MIDVVIRYSNETAFFNRMAALGVPAHSGDNPDGGKYRKEDLFSHTANGEWPLVDDVTGEMYVSVRLTTEDAGKIPNNDQNPAFAIVWRSDEYDTTDPDNPVHYPRPEAERNLKDEEGNVIGTRMQPVGIIL